jgi:glycerol-3-phosphate acyltransferase PlsY
MTVQPSALPSPRRPVAITVICVLCAIGALITIPLIFSEVARSIGAWYPPYLAFSAVVGLACTVGLWLMRKWVIYLYTALVVLNQIVLFSMGVWNVLALAIPLVVIIVGFIYLSRMR